MIVRLNEYTKQRQEISVKTLTIEMEDGTLFRISDGPDPTALEILRIGGREASLRTHIIVMPIVGNKIAIA